MNSKVVIAFNRVEKDTPDFFKFRSIKKYFNTNRISYYDIFNIVKLYDHSNNDYSPIESIVFESNIDEAAYLVTDASANKKIITAIKRFIYVHSSTLIKLMKSNFTDEKIFDAIKYLQSEEGAEVNNKIPDEISIDDNSSVEEIAMALLSPKVNAEGKYKDIF